MKKIGTRGWLTIGMLILAASLWIADRSWAADKELAFAPGTSGATVEGAVIRGESDTYRLKAKAGQTMTVEISSTEDNAVFQIYTPGKGDRTLDGAGEGEDAMSYQGVLPLSGTYRIVVGPTRGNAEYKLRVEIVN